MTRFMVEYYAISQYGDTIYIYCGVLYCDMPCIVWPLVYCVVRQRIRR